MLITFSAVMAVGFCAPVSASSGTEERLPQISVPSSTTVVKPSADEDAKADDITLFKKYLVDDPQTAVKAMVRILQKKDSSGIVYFEDKNCDRISEMLVTLHSEYNNKQIDENDYDEISMKLAAYDIHTVQWRNSEKLRNRFSEKRMRNYVEAPRHWPPEDNVTPSSPKAQITALNPIDALVDARMMVTTGDKKSSVKAIETATEYFKDNSRVHIAASSLYYETSYYNKAEDAATEAITIDNKDPDGYKVRAVARIAMNNRKGAMEDIKKAVAMDPNDESARLLGILVESRKPVQTITTLNSLQEMRRQLGIQEDYKNAPSPVAIGKGGSGSDETPSSGDSAISNYAASMNYLKTAQTKRKLGDNEGALDYAKLAIEKDPTNLEAYMERATIATALGQYEDVIRDTSFIIEKDPKNIAAFNMRAWALTQNNKPEDAVNDASRAIGINPNFADAWANRAAAYEKKGEYKKMLEDLKQAAALNESYKERYDDAVFKYAGNIPGYMKQQKELARLGSEVSAEPSSPNSLGRFLLLLVFTLVGGALIALGITHITSGQIKKNHGLIQNPEGAKARVSHPDILSPSVFYEGVATGKYKIQSKVGEGAMGQVYLAVDKSLGRKVAIKRMNEEIKKNESEKKRFLDEARTVALLHHPNIVEIYTIFEEDGDIYLVFEYVNGHTLDKILGKEEKLSFDRTRDIFDEVAKALSYAHSKGIVHRDLKLGNIMLSNEGDVKVMDFGLARRAMEARSSSFKKEIVGSPAYMAPEQEMGASSIRSDIYSLGVCIYECITGKLPFSGSDFYTQKIRKEYEPASKLIPGITKEVDELIDKCLAVESYKRFSNADEFRSALNKIVI